MSYMSELNDVVLELIEHPQKLIELIRINSKLAHDCTRNMIAYEPTSSARILTVMTHYWQQKKGGDSNGFFAEIIEKTQPDSRGVRPFTFDSDLATFAASKNASTLKMNFKDLEHISRELDLNNEDHLIFFLMFIHSREPLKLEKDMDTVFHPTKSTVTYLMYDHEIVAKYETYLFTTPVLSIVDKENCKQLLSKKLRSYKEHYEKYDEVALDIIRLMLNQLVKCPGPLNTGAHLFSANEIPFREISTSQEKSDLYVTRKEPTHKSTFYITTKEHIRRVNVLSFLMDTKKYDLLALALKLTNSTQLAAMMRSNPSSQMAALGLIPPKETFQDGIIACDNIAVMDAFYTAVRKMSDLDLGQMLSSDQMKHFGLKLYRKSPTLYQRFSNINVIIRLLLNNDEVSAAISEGKRAAVNLSQVPNNTDSLYSMHQGESSTAAAARPLIAPSVPPSAPFAHAPVIVDTPPPAYASASTTNTLTTLYPNARPVLEEPLEVRQPVPGGSRWEFENDSGRDRGNAQVNELEEEYDPSQAPFIRAFWM